MLAPQVLALETSRRSTRTSNSGGTDASPMRVTAQTVEDRNWLNWQGAFRVKPNLKGGLSGPTSAESKRPGIS